MKLLTLLLTITCLNITYANTTNTKENNKSINKTQTLQNRYITAETLLNLLNNKSEKSIKGPFLLTIKSITQNGTNTYLNTQADANSSQNIALQIPAFLKNQFSRHYKSNLSALFLNGNLIVSGNASMQELITTELNPKIKQVNQSKQSERKLTPMIKIVSMKQLAHYD